MNIDIHDLPRLMANPSSPDATALAQRLNERVVQFTGRQYTVTDWRTKIEQIILHNTNGSPYEILCDNDAVPCIPVSEAEKLLRRQAGFSHRHAIIPAASRIHYRPTSETRISKLTAQPRWLSRIQLGAFYIGSITSIIGLLPSVLSFLLMVCSVTGIVCTHWLETEKRHSAILYLENQLLAAMLRTEPENADVVLTPDQMLYHWIELFTGGDPYKGSAALEAWHAAWSDPVGFRHMRWVSSLYTQMNRLPSGGDSDLMQDKITETLSFVITQTSTGELGHTNPAPPSLHEWKGTGLAQHPAESEDHLR